MSVVEVCSFCGGEHVEAPRITREEYDKLRRHDYAGPLSTMVYEDNAWHFAAMGGNAWRLEYNKATGGTLLGPVFVEGLDP